MSRIPLALFLVLCACNCGAEQLTFLFSGEVTRVEPGYESLAYEGEAVSGTVTYDLDTPHFWQQAIWSTYDPGNNNAPVPGMPPMYPGAPQPGSTVGGFTEAFPAQLEIAIGSNPAVQQSVALVLENGAILGDAFINVGGIVSFSTGDFETKLRMISESQVAEYYGHYLNGATLGEIETTDPWVSLDLATIDLTQFVFRGRDAPGPIVPLRDLARPSNFAVPLEGFISAKPSSYLRAQSTVVNFSITHIVVIPEPQALTLLTLACLGVCRWRQAAA